MRRKGLLISSKISERRSEGLGLRGSKFAAAEHGSIIGRESGGLTDCFRLGRIRQPSRDLLQKHHNRDLKSMLGSTKHSAGTFTGYIVCIITVVTLHDLASSTVRMKIIPTQWTSSHLRSASKGAPRSLLSSQCQGITVENHGET